MFARRAETTNLAQTSIHDFLTTMTDIDKAIEYLDSLGPGEFFCYTRVAEEFGVVRSTLTRRHQGISTDRKAQK